MAILGSSVVRLAKDREENMQKTLRAAGAIGFAAVLVAASTAVGWAQEWQPTEEVEIVTHVGTTSSTWANADAIAKVINAKNLFPKGVTVKIIEGARGAKARAYVAKEHAGDPHVLQMLVPTQINNPILARSDIDRSLFRGVALLVVTPKAITVNADSPYETFDDLIAAARARPGELIHGGGSLGSTSSMVSRIMEDYFDIDVTYTPFDDQGVIQLLGGHVDYIFAQPELVGKFVKSGNMRFLAASQKLAEYPDVPTLAELGHDFEVLDSYRGIWTSKDVPDEAIGFYVRALEQVFNSEEYQDFVKRNSITTDWVAGAELEDQLDTKVEVFKKIAGEMGLIGK
jgi:tripartite-type tricarboxylate transporter receptor subunit TctC